MNKYILYLFITLGLACSQFNKGVIEKRELRKKKPPSVRIAEEYDKGAKKNKKTYNNPKKAAKAREKATQRQKKAGDKYLKKKRRKLK